MRNQLQSDIKDWINGSRDFNAGIMLLVASGANPSIVEPIRKRMNAHALYDILRDLYFELKKAEPAAAPLSKPVQKNGSTETASDSTWEKLKREWHRTAVAQEAAHAEIRVVFKDDVITEAQQQLTAAAANTVMLCHNRLILIGQAMEFYKTTGQLPSDFQFTPLVKPAPATKKLLTDAEKILRLKNQINPRISKLKAKLKTVETDADRQLILAKLQELEKEKEELYG